MCDSFAFFRRLSIPLRLELEGTWVGVASAIPSRVLLVR